MWSAGLSLRQPNNSNIPLLAGAAAKALGGDLDAYLLGNVRLVLRTPGRMR